MARTTITAVTGQIDFLDDLETFLSSNGWTIDSSVAGPPRIIDFHRSIGGKDFYYRLASNTGSSRIDVTAYTGASQTGSTYTGNMSFANTTVGDIEVISNTDSLYILGKQTFIRGMIGRLNLTYAAHSTDVTGSFVFVYNGSTNFFRSLDSTGTTTSASGHVRIRATSGNLWQPSISSNVVGGSASPSQSRFSFWFSVDPGLRGVNPLFDIRVFVADNPLPGSGGTHYLAGTIPNAKILPSRGMTSNSDFVVGGDTYYLCTVGDTGILFGFKV